MACRKMRGRDGVRQRGATVAQQFCKLRVAGSNPVAGSIENRRSAACFAADRPFSTPSKKSLPPSCRNRKFRRNRSRGPRKDFQTYPGAAPRDLRRPSIGGRAPVGLGDPPPASRASRRTGVRSLRRPPSGRAPFVLADLAAPADSTGTSACRRPPCGVLPAASSRQPLSSWCIFWALLYACGSLEGGGVHLFGTFARLGQRSVGIGPLPRRQEE